MEKKIYGVSSKYEFGAWHHKLYVFYSKEAAEEWLYTDEFDFRERELMSKAAAQKLLGKKVFAEAEFEAISNAAI